MPDDTARDTRPRARGSRVTAVLGPTNTGKTHLAIERMLGHRTGMIGLPLRLLAREVYDRVVARLGPDVAALITGEEKIIPAAPRFYVSTVEAMPLDVAVDFLAIDEIQLAADSERGHIFTDRMLHARGELETMLLGAATMHGQITRLLPGANFVSRPRFSRLSYTGPRKLTRLGRRSALVAFSADRVYALAEMVRRQRGGAAVVLGALSPRTRNAQVELYQSGDVDFLVATDAIGMGLNMDVDHVSFAGRRKFDGQVHRNLTAAELAQIAGRAGRHMNDGSFGTSGEDIELDSDTVERIENHRFDPVRVVWWRNNDLDFRSIDRLIASLSIHPREEGLMRTRRGDDFAALEFLSRTDEVAGTATSPDAVALLWEACQLPDYRKVGIGEHAAIVARVFRFLTGVAGVVPEDWLARQVAYADRIEGDIDTLANRIAHIRTWTFVANHSGWLDDARHWQEKTREVENNLSDALHERLSERFVDRRTSVLMKRLSEKDALAAGVTDDGEVVVEGEFVGRLDGLRFALDGSARAGADSKALQAAAMKVLGGELAVRAQAIAGEQDAVFAVTDTGYVTWRGATIARLEGGDTVLRPQVRLIVDDQLPAPDREQVLARVEAWLADHLRTVLAPLYAILADETITGLARGVGFQLVEHLGLLARDTVAHDVHRLDQEARAGLRRHGVRFGAFSIYVPALLKPQPAALRLVLFRLHQEAQSGLSRDDWPAPPQAGLTSLDVGEDAPAGLYAAAGYRLCGRRAVRADMLERLGDTIRPLVGWKPPSDGAERPEGAHPSGGFTVTPLMMSLVGCSGDDMAAILTALGFRREMHTPPKVVASVAPGDAAAGNGAEADVGGTGAAPGAPAEPAPQAPAAGAADSPVSDGAGEDASPAAATAEPEPAAASEEVEVWRPRPRRRERPPRQASERGKGRADKRADGRKGNRKDGRGRARPASGKGGGPGGNPRKPPRPPDKEFSEDSPFAALRALKERLESDTGQPTS